MGLQFIYGRAGSGKSEYCFKNIKKDLQTKEKIYIITPEQFSFTQEKKLLEYIKKEAIVQAEVITFNRMAYRVIKKTGGLTKVNLSKSGKAMLIATILEKQKNNLTFLKKSDDNIQMIEQEIKELKKHMITEQHLKNVINKTQDNYLKAKLEDIYVLYENYQTAIENNYIDEEDILTTLVNAIDKTDLFKDSSIYIDEFSGFTKQEYEVIRKLLHIAKEVHITICTDKLEQSQDENDIFSENKQTIAKLEKIAKQENIKINSPVYLSQLKRFKNPELTILEHNLSKAKNEKYEEKTKHISLFLAKNPFSELEQVAIKINNLVKNQGYNYKDISVITKQIEKEAPIIQAVFTRFSIPFFMDQKKVLSQNALIKYLLAILEIFSKNWSYEAMFDYIKSGFCNINNEDIFILENYCIEYGIRGNKWYKEDWKIAQDDESLERLNKLRKEISEPLIQFQQKASKGKNARELSKIFYEFLIQNQTDKKLIEQIQNLENNGKIELASLYQTTWDIVIQLFDEIVLVLQDEKISFDMYKKIWKIGLQNSKLGAIPATCDQVIIGDVERSRSHKVKACFLIGLNDGVFPSPKKEEGFLNDEDRNYLKSEDIELAKSTKEQLYEENFNIYKAFMVPEQELYLSYTSSDSLGKTLRPSILISNIKRIFPKLEQKSDMIQKEDAITTKEATFYQLLENIRKWYDSENINKIWFEVYNFYKKDEEYNKKLQKFEKAIIYKNKPALISKQNIQKLYGTTLKTSISKLEQYKRCGFSFYLKYGLELKEKKLYKIQSINTGSLMHEIIDEFFEQVLQRKIKLKNITKQETEQIVKSILNEKLTLNRNYIFTSSKKYILLTKRLEKLVLKAIDMIILTIINSKFDIIGNEVEFNKNKDYPPIEIQLEDGKKVEITGKIDRIDIAKGGEGNYIRIIDYKSSIKNIDLNEVVAGLQIQLLTYLDAIAKSKQNVIPAGVFYFNVIDPIIKLDKNKTTEEIEQEIKKQFKMQGLILADVNVVRMMDKELQKGASNLVPAYIDQSDTLSASRSNAITKEQFESLQTHIKKVIKDIAKEIYIGKMEIMPYYNKKNKKTPCEYCPYKSICNFNTNDNSYYYIQNKEKEQILEEIKKEQV